MAVAEQFVDDVDEVEEEEEDPDDPQDVLKEKCSELSTCSKLKEIFDECEGNSSEGSAPCSEELYDFVHCVDHCVAKNLFKNLK